MATARIPDVMPGTAYGRWTVLSTAASRPRYILCRCACGKEREVFSSNLWNGTSPSCGACSRTTPAIERFWRYVVKDDGPDACWTWTGGCYDNGYGAFTISTGRHVAAHRFAYVTFVGPIADEQKVLHRCDNPPCVNYEIHLFPGTQRQNMEDKVEKGRQQSKLTPSDVLQCREMLAAGVPQRTIAARFGVRQGTISFIASRKNWKHL